jgi:hypothetical protein
MGRVLRACTAVLLLAVLATPAAALDSDDLEELLGYTMIAHTNVDGEFEGVDFGKVIALENGMVFEFNEFNYTYAYRPSVAIFAMKVTADEIQKFGLGDKIKGPLTLYKLVIDDEIYDASRVR